MLREHCVAYVSSPSDRCSTLSRRAVPDAAHGESARRGERRGVLRAVGGWREGRGGGDEAAHAGPDAASLRAEEDADAGEPSREAQDA